jgi:hypothetical protein
VKGNESPVRYSKELIPDPAIKELRSENDKTGDRARAAPAAKERERKMAALLVQPVHKILWIGRVVNRQPTYR